VKAVAHPVGAGNHEARGRTSVTATALLVIHHRRRFNSRVIPWLRDEPRQAPGPRRRRRCLGVDTAPGLSRGLRLLLGGGEYHAHLSANRSEGTEAGSQASPAGKTGRASRPGSAGQVLLQRRILVSTSCHRACPSFLWCFSSFPAPHCSPPVLMGMKATRLSHFLWPGRKWVNARTRLTS
jgi:hypothetical protein